jgi:hypothetical protein
MNDWSHLPNAGHIDRIIASVKAHPEAWAAVEEAGCGSVRDAARTTVWQAVWGGDDKAWLLAHDVVWNVAKDAIHDGRDKIRYAVNYSILALIAYDNAAKFLKMSSDQLKIWAPLSEEPAAILMLPAVIAFERINKGL